MRILLLIGLGVALIFCALPVTFSEEKLEVYKEEELLQLFKDEKYIIVLLSEEEQCTTGRCELLEDALLTVREDMVEGTGAWVIRSYAPEFSKRMHLQGSNVMFMRDERPLLYSGDANDEEQLLNYFIKNKVSNVHNLTDDTFEHETQAGTGSTTGDWLVMFTRRDCDECRVLAPVLEAVAVNLKGRKNVAFIERETGAVTARRVAVKTFPFFILFRLGKLYRYTFGLNDVGHLTSFAEDTFRNVQAEDVPAPKSPFDDVTEAAADWLKENPGTFLLFTGGILLAFVIIFLLNRTPPESWTKKTKQKKS